MRGVRSSVALAILAVAGCESPFAPGGCTDEARPGLRVAVFDSLTGTSLAPTRVVAAAGAYVDSATVVADAAAATARPSTYGLAHERAGVYSVTVEGVGYRAWRREGIRVRAGECHVRTVEVVARLQKLP